MNYRDAYTITFFINTEKDSLNYIQMIYMTWNINSCGLPKVHIEYLFKKCNAYFDALNLKGNMF